MIVHACHEVKHFRLNRIRCIFPDVPGYLMNAAKDANENVTFQ
jgi:hypothetical protein